MTFVQWYVGGCIAMPLARVFPPTPNELFANLAHPALNKLVTVPFVLEQLIPLLRENNNHGFQLLSRFRFVMTTGAICSPNMGHELVDNGINFVIHFGATGNFLRPHLLIFLCQPTRPREESMRIGIYIKYRMKFSTIGRKVRYALWNVLFATARMVLLRVKTIDYIAFKTDKIAAITSTLCGFNRNRLYSGQ